jgi:hypothetical protein
MYTFSDFLHTSKYICTLYVLEHIRERPFNLKEFWVKIQQILKKYNIENFVTLKHIVFGYKIFDKDYFDFNYFLTILGFSIYKAYYVSEQNTKQVNIYSLFVREYITRISQVQKLQNSKLLAKIRENIEM